MTSREIYHAVHEFGRAGFLEARPDVERLLTSDDPELRYITLETLTRHRRLTEHYATAQQFLEHDPDTFCRMMGASALEGLQRNMQDRQTLGILARVVGATRKKCLLLTVHHGGQMVWECTRL